MDQLPSGVNIRKALTLEKACTSFCLPNGGNQRGGDQTISWKGNTPVWLVSWCRPSQANLWLRFGFDLFKEETDGIKSSLDLLFKVLYQTYDNLSDHWGTLKIIVFWGGQFKFVLWIKRSFLIWWNLVLVQSTIFINI